MASVNTERIIVMLSAIPFMCGTSSLISMPDLPHRSKANLLGATGKRFWPLVMVVMRWPLRIESGSSWSKYFVSYQFNPFTEEPTLSKLLL